VSTHAATFYVQIEPQFYAFDKSQVQAIRAVALTQKRPARQRPGTTLVKLTVRIPDAAFLPFAPEAVIVVPEDMVAAGQPIEIEAGDPA
jgi:hypothetical protein